MGLQYQFDNMGRLSTRRQGNCTYAGSQACGSWGSTSTFARANYSAVSQITSTSYGLPDNPGVCSETLNYNNLMQLTQETGNGKNMTYTYSATQNNGRMTQSVDDVTGESLLLIPARTGREEQ